MQAYMAQNKLQEALNTGLPVLKQLGVEFPSEPNFSDIGQALGETASILSGKGTEDLIDLPLMTDPQQLATITILSSLFSPAYIALPPLAPLVVCKQVNLSVQYGNASVSPYAFAIYSYLLCGMGDIERGYQFGEMALRLLSKLDAKEIQAKTSAMVHSSIQPWKEHLRNTLETFAVRLYLWAGNWRVRICELCYLSIQLLFVFYWEATNATRTRDSKLRRCR
jgi:predicted ATPase